MQKSKALWRKAQVVRITYEPDYGDEAWERDGEVPTPATDPDAFYARRESAYPLPKKISSRKSPHDRLSIRALRKRLYQAGVRGNELSRIAAEIYAKPVDLTGPVGEMALGWNVKTFKERFGKRISRAVLKFVSTRFMFVDEAWSLLGNSSFVPTIESMFSTMRKFNAASITVTQVDPV